MTALATILADLESKCRAATPGRWEYNNRYGDAGFVYAPGHIVTDTELQAPGRDYACVTDTDGAYIAAWSPDRALRFVALARAAAVIAEPIDEGASVRDAFHDHCKALDALRAALAAIGEGSP